MTDDEIHAVARKMYEAHIHNLGVANKEPAWGALDKAGRSHWRHIAKIAIAEISRLSEITL